MLQVMLYILSLISLLLSIKLTIDDFKQNKVFVWEFILFIVITLFLKLLPQHIQTFKTLPPTFSLNWLVPNMTVFLAADIYIQAKILTGLIFGVLVLWAVIEDKLATADAILILAIFLTQNLIEFLLIMCIASLTGILLAILFKRKDIPFLSILIPLWIIY